MTTSVFVWTAPGANYPAFLNVSNATDAHGEPTVKITVRGPINGDGSCGQTAEVVLPSMDYAGLVGHLRHHHDEILR